MNSYVRYAVAAMAMATALGACTLDSTSETTQQVGSVVLTTDMSSYGIGADVTVTFSGMSGVATDWVALARTVDSNLAYEAWAYTGGGAAGTVVFTAPSLPAGTYEARGFFDWNGTQSYTIQGTSPSFTVGSAISTDALAYNSGDAVTVTYNGLPGNATDWIAIAPSGSPNTTFTRWAYTPGTPSGQVVFNGVPDGTYVARSFPNDGFVLAAESPSFNIGSQVSLTTTLAVYDPTANPVANYSGLTTDVNNWITVVPAGAPLTTYNEWYYTGGATSGSVQFAPLAVGQYEVRAFYRDGFTLAKSVAFTVAGGPTVLTAGTYNAGDTVTVTFLDTPGNAKDWIAVSPAGSPATTYTAWSYTNGAVNGTRDFASLPAGSYEARAYSNDTFTIIASSTFTIASTATTTTDATSYAANGTVTVSWTGLPGSVTDWIALSVSGSPDTSYSLWVYTAGAKSGSTQFANVPSGTYEARSYTNDSFNVAARSAAFTVGP